MHEAGDAGDEQPPGDKPRPLQFSLRSLFILTAVFSALFGILRWLEVSATASALVLAMLLVGAVAAVGLLLAIVRSTDRWQ